MGRITRTYKTILLSLLPVVLLFAPSLVSAEVSLNSAAQYVVWLVVASVTGMFLWFGSLILDAGVEIFVLGFSDTYTKSGVGVAIDTSWVIIRDAMNLFFVFGLVYIGFRMILDSDNGNVRRWLVNLIIAALLINFSLFITKFVVDFTNLLSYEIASEGLGGQEVDGKIKLNLSTEFKTRMGVQSILGGVPTGAGWSFIFGTGIFFTITAFVFAAGGIMLMIRFAILSLFLALSPLMFLSWVLPMLRDSMNKYWSEFLGRAFYAPVYLFFIYLSLQLIGGMQRSIGGGGIANPKWHTTLQAKSGNELASGSASDAALGTLPFFIVICIFMIMSIVIAGKLSSDGAAWSQKMAGKATGGAMGRLGRNTIGRGANALANSDRLKDRAVNGNFLQRSLARGTLGAAGYGAKASFDPRAIPGVSDNKYVNPGKAKQGGFKKDLEDKVKKEKDRMKELGEVDIKKEGKEQYENERARLQAEAKAREAEAKRAGDELEEDKDKTEDELIAAITALTEEIKDEEKALTDGIADKTLTELEQQQAQESIDSKRLRITAKQSNFSVSQAASEKERARLELSLAEANGASPQEQAEAREAFQKAEMAYTNELNRRTAELESETSSAVADHSNASKKAEASVKYQRQIAEMNRMRESVWNKSLREGKYTTQGAGVIGGALGGIATLSLVGASLGLSEAGAHSAKHKKVLEELEKEYGKDGLKKVKKSKEEADAKKLMAAVKKSAGEDDDKKEEGDAK